MQETEKLYAREEAGRQALGLMGRTETTDFKEAFSNFKKAYEFLKEEFEAALKEVDYVAIAQSLCECGYASVTPSMIKEALSTSDVADPEKEPNV